jgi:hypothetical protein
LTQIERAGFGVPPGPSRAAIILRYPMYIDAPAMPRPQGRSWSRQPDDLARASATAGIAPQRRGRRKRGGPAGGWEPNGEATQLHRHDFFTKPLSNVTRRNQAASSAMLCISYYKVEIRGWLPCAIFPPTTHILQKGESMKSARIVPLLIGVLGLAASGAAMAGGLSVGVNIGIPAPVYVAPAPMYALRRLPSINRLPCITAARRS